MTDNRTPDMALLPGERAMSAVEWAEYGGLPPTMKEYCHRLIRDEAEIRRRQRIDELEAAEWRARSMRAVDRLGAAEQRAAAAEQRGRLAERAEIVAYLRLAAEAHGDPAMYAEAERIESGAFGEYAEAVRVSVAADGL